MFPDRNDHFLDRNFEFKKTNFTIVIHPGSTKFWRLGFRFSKDEYFPSIGSGRHGDSNFPDIHISVGDIVDMSNNTWGAQNQLTLTTYNAKAIDSKINSLHDYAGTDVIFTMTSNPDGSMVEFKIETNGQSGGSSTYDLHEYNFCKIFAWADYEQFLLDTEIEVIHKD